MHVWILPLSSCHPDNVAWLWTETMAGMCVMCSQVWLRMQELLIEGTDASAAPADCTQTKASFLFALGGKNHSQTH